MVVGNFIVTQTPFLIWCKVIQWTSKTTLGDSIDSGVVVPLRLRDPCTRIRAPYRVST